MSNPMIEYQARKGHQVILTKAAVEKQFIAELMELLEDPCLRAEDKCIRAFPMIADYKEIIEDLRSDIDFHREQLDKYKTEEDDGGISYDKEST